MLNPKKKKIKQNFHLNYTTRAPRRWYTLNLAMSKNRSTKLLCSVETPKVNIVLSTRENVNNKIRESANADAHKKRKKEKTEKKILSRRADITVLCFLLE